MGWTLPHPLFLQAIRSSTCETVQSCYWHNCLPVYMFIRIWWPLVTQHLREALPPSWCGHCQNQSRMRCRVCSLSLDDWEEKRHQRHPSQFYIRNLAKVWKIDRNRIRKWETISMSLSSHMIMIDHDPMIHDDSTWLTVCPKKKAPTCFLDSLSIINWNLLICASDRDKVPRMHKQALTSCSVRTILGIFQNQEN